MGGFNIKIKHSVVSLLLNIGYNFGILTIMKVSSLPKSNIISKKLLFELYINKKQSSFQISKLLKCSENKINYWLKKYNIEKRNISDAVYYLKNPLGDPFIIKNPKTIQEGILFGLGIGIYWGEGLKRKNGGVRLTNTDIKMVIKFIKFLEEFFNIDRNKLRFSIQIFEDLVPEEALNYWKNGLGVKKEQFYKTIISKVRGEGTYKNKSKHGVIIVYFNNIKLKKIILEMIEKV